MNIDNKGNISDTWDYRVVRKTTEDGEELLGIQEVYYDDETGEPIAHTMDLEVVGDDIDDLKETLQRMLRCLDKEIIDEIQNGVMDSNVEDRVLSLEIENAEMKVRLTELNDIIKDTPNNMELGGKVRGL